jgi:hypothetical protein
VEIVEKSATNGVAVVNIEKEKTHGLKRNPTYKIA